MGKIIGIISIKGGVGKTTTVSNLGTILAKDFGKNVLIVDANFSAPNLGIHLGIVQPEKSLSDIMKNKADIHNAIYKHELGFSIIPGSLLTNKIDVYLLKKKLKEVKDEYDIILLDSSPNLNHEILATMVASDELLVITTPDYPTLSTTLGAVKTAKQKKTPIVGLILNKVLNKKFELTTEDIENASNCPVLAVLPNEIKILEALSLVKPAALHTPMSNAIVEYKKLAAFLLGQDYNDTRLKTKINNILGKVSKQELNRKSLLADRLPEIEQPK